MNKATFQEADFQKQADLQYSNLQKAELLEVILEEANFQEANLEAAVFQEADLRGANFKKANLKKTIFIAADLTDITEFEEVIVTNFEEANLEMRWRYFGYGG